VRRNKHALPDRISVHYQRDSAHLPTMGKSGRGVLDKASHALANDTGIEADERALRAEREEMA
jgi:hypothetical protein